MEAKRIDEIDNLKFYITNDQSVKLIMRGRRKACRVSYNSVVLQHRSVLKIMHKNDFFTVAAIVYLML